MSGFLTMPGEGEVVFVVMANGPGQRAQVVRAIDDVVRAIAAGEDR